MSKGKLALPTIRFEGFEDEWEEKPLGDVLSLANGYAFKSEYFCKDKTGYEVLTPGSVHIGGGFQYGKGQNYKLEGKTPQKFIFAAGDVFITMTDLTPTAQMLGLPAIVPDDGTTYLHNQRLGKLIQYKGDYGFLFYLLSTDTYRNQIVATSSGTTVKHSSPDKVKSSKFFFPNKVEQTSLGYYFQNVDKQLKLHQDKFAKLQQLKKAMLGKMFPKAGQTVPELRFAGFSEKWEVEPLGTNASFNKGKGFTKGDLNTFGVPIVLYGRLYTNYQTIITEVDTFVSSESKGIMSKGREVIVPASGESAEDIARASAVLQPNVILGGDLNIIYPNNKILPSFLALIITYSCCQAELAKKAQGKSVVHVRNSDIKDLLVPMPTIKEQTKIAEYFQNLDRLINLQQQQIDKLKNLKQTYLAKMFV
ncbi:restriction endonuclease subunit S [Vibrio tapetis]|uniref:Type I restriction modification system DNA specificity subunit Hsds n=2 Tax=Vibrio tapetis TaxID=52443 RepID=A0A2N8ZHQ1_9VIBR|nr:restriction endonuclease subunit S [Vibrio tapetis]ACB99646.1 type I restriction modification system DNA specificity subunit Hsds [Vibrio tapetis]SON51443.1 Type I restriction modification system DNA specificity subunit Hsds [Vibrio tapetis subsp. tapetis]SON53501.1 Type I restriction modification system DNA specificity subunit Hsds [Vibrio tapetis subsp. tapetis]